MVTETHFSRSEVDGLRTENYEGVAKDCRVDVAVGGVRILASSEVDAQVVRDAPCLPFPLNACSILLYSGGLEGN